MRAHPQTATPCRHRHFAADAATLVVLFESALSSVDQLKKNAFLHVLGVAFAIYLLQLYLQPEATGTSR